MLFEVVDLCNSRTSISNTRSRVSSVLLTFQAQKRPSDYELDTQKTGYTKENNYF